MGLHKASLAFWGIKIDLGVLPFFLLLGLMKYRIVSFVARPAVKLGQTERTIERFILRSVTELSGKQQNRNPNAFYWNCHVLPRFRDTNDRFVASIQALFKLEQGKYVFFLYFAIAISSPARSLAGGYRYRHSHRRHWHCRCCHYWHYHCRRRRFRCHRQ